jgi:hypothetical protein
MVIVAMLVVNNIGDPDAPGAFRGILVGSARAGVPPARLLEVMNQAIFAPIARPRRNNPHPTSKSSL